jgi:uncharacterized protein (TIGR03435 family)
MGRLSKSPLLKAQARTVAARAPSTLSRSHSDFSLKGLVRDAYKIELYQINAPDWFGDQCYDVVAKLPEGGAKEQIPFMLQALLAERFHMKAHLETRQDRDRDMISNAEQGRHGRSLSPVIA